MFNEETLGDEIKKWRQNAGYTQQTMADAFEMPKRTIENWEGNQRQPSGWIAKLIINKLMQDTEKYIWGKMEEYAKSCKSDEDGNRPEITWALKTERPTEEYIERAGSMEEAMKMQKEAGEGEIICLLVNKGTNSWYCDRKGNCQTDYWDVEI